MCSICLSLSSTLSPKNFVVEVIPADVTVAPSRAQGWTYDGRDAFLDLDDRGGVAGNGLQSFTTDEAAVQLNRTGRSWAGSLGTPVTVTYAFRSTDPGASYNGGGGSPDNFSRMTATQIAVVELMLAAWADVAGLTFVRVGSGTTGEGAYSDSATMLFANYSENDSAAAFAYLANVSSTGATSAAGDVWVNLFDDPATTPIERSYNVNPTYLGYGYQTLVHEIGHALGLSHPGDYNAGQGSPTYADATYYEDTRQYSVMSYWSESNTGASFGGRYASAPLLDDIAAAQRMYGANMSTRTGDTVYGFNSNAGRIWYDASQGGASQAVIFSIWDAGGNDILDFSGYSQNGVIDLRQGHFSSVGGLTGNVSIAIGAVIEQAIGGSGADTIVGNAADNVLRGNGGADILDGGVGADTAVFSGSSSSYTITASTETVDGVTYQVLLVSGADGSDRLYNIEFLQFSNGTIAVPAAAAAGIRLEGDRTDNTLTGTAYADLLFGAGGNDILNAGDGNDVLISGRGSDTLNGGNGVDTADYSSFTGGLTINLATGQTTKPAGEGGGTDTLSSIENVRGTAFSDTITGDGGANRIEGGGGVDVLNGGGGADVIIAGAGVATSPAAPDVVKAQGTANTSIATAVNVDANFDLVADAGFTNPTTVPHAKITATTNGGGKEYYAFTVGAGVTAIFDINGGTFDTVIEIFDASGNRIAVNDDGGGDGTNSYLSQSFAAGGTYYIAVSQWVSGSGNSIVTQNPAAGQTYGLNISIPGHAVNGLTFSGSTLNGDDGDDFMHSGSGNDTINGGAGTDTAVYTGARSAYTVTDLGGGSFRVTGPDGTGTDTLNGVERIQFSDQMLNLAGNVPTAGDDVLTGTEGDDVIDGLAGNDTINGLGGADRLTGGLGNDALNGGDGADQLYGDDGDDILNGGASYDLLMGGAGSDTLNGDAGQDYLDGGDGDDILNGGLDGDTLIGGNGADQLFGSEGDDILQGGASYDLLSGGVGNDNLQGGVGSDYLDGGDGDDILSGGADADTLIGGAGFDRAVFAGARGTATFSINGAGQLVVTTAEGADLLSGIERLQFSDQTLDITLGGAGASTINGTAGDDILVGQSANDRLFGADGADILLGGGSYDYLNGGVGDDYLDGGDGSDYLEGDLGNDTLYGGADGDTLFGGDGADRLFGQDGDDILNGGASYDLLVGGAGRDQLNGDAGSDYLDGGDGNDYMNGGADADTLLGGTGADELYGDQGDDLLFGGDSYDLLHGGDGDDTLRGEAGSDYLVGAAGADILVGGADADTLVGEAGADRYVYLAASDSTVAARDIILGFEIGQDKIDLTSIRTGSSDAFSFTVVGGSTFLNVDLGGNGSIDTSIEIRGVTGLSASDIIWTPPSAAPLPEAGKPLIAEVSPQGEDQTWVSPAAQADDSLILPLASGPDKAAIMDGPLILPTSPDQPEVLPVVPSNQLDYARGWAIHGRAAELDFDTIDDSSGWLF